MTVHIDDPMLFQVTSRWEVARSSVVMRRIEVIQTLDGHVREAANKGDHRLEAYAQYTYGENPIKQKLLLRRKLQLLDNRNWEQDDCNVTQNVERRVCVPKSS